MPPTAEGLRHASVPAPAREPRHLPDGMALHPLTLRLLSVVIVLARLGICRAHPDQPGLPDLLARRSLAFVGMLADGSLLGGLRRSR